MKFDPPRKRKKTKTRRSRFLTTRRARVSRNGAEEKLHERERTNHGEAPIRIVVFNRAFHGDSPFRRALLFVDKFRARR